MTAESFLNDLQFIYQQLIFQLISSLERLDFIVYENSAFLILVILAFLKLRVLLNILWYRAFSNFIGTFFHELAHFSVALLFLTVPSSMSLMPKREGQMHTYGSVSITIDKINVINKFPIAMAPLILFPLIVFNDNLKQLYFQYFGINFISITTYIYCISIIIINAIPSISDFKMAKGASLILWIFITIIAYIYIDYNDVLIMKETIEEVFYKIEGIMKW